MAKKHKHPEHENLERWLISYADFITLLFAFFVVMWSMRTDNPPSKPVIEGIKRAFNSFGEKTAAQQTVVALADTGGSPAIFSMEPMYQNIEAGIKQIGIKGASVNKVDRGIIIRIPDEALFEVGRAEVNEDFKKKLDSTGTLLKELPNQIQIEGHTDNVPIHTAVYPSNWELSTSRATAIMRHFVERNGLPPQKFTLAGYSEYHPIDTNDTPEGRAKNRRIDILVVKSDEKKPSQATPGIKGIIKPVQAVEVTPLAVH
ncbi:MAG: OmpA family protein [Nitrospirae bacterium]|nr:OmpA family protein [Candidatus Troglogloeales bacterium]